ncbi:MAG: helix-turn-helix transcriptional regulator [Planctomycetes bacterium]|nr:helix-turn-helix transcriptional regulator [Planctomycetota bacterium]MBL7037246.1 helix-turn-helix transcriptional regulator [Pirellulaceae bacterium]
MAKKKTKRIVRKLTGEEKARHAKIRDQVMKEFPPAKEKKHQPVRTGIAAELRKARKARGLTYYAVAKQAGIPNSNTVKDVEYGRDAKLSNIEAIAEVLGLKLEVVDASS